MKSTVPVSALIDFAKLEIGAWFVFPQALMRLTNSDTVCVEEDRRLSIMVKIDRHFFAPLQVSHNQHSYQRISEDPSKPNDVVEVQKPQFVPLSF